MLLKDCPVGSVVRLANINRDDDEELWEMWFGPRVVYAAGGRAFVKDNTGVDRFVGGNSNFQFEIVTLAPEPRITFTVGGQEFYVGQRVWSIDADDEEHIKVGDEFVVSGSACNEYEPRLAIRRHESASHIFALPKGISTTPLAPHEWKRGDWARHEENGVVFITGQKSYNDCAMFVTDDKGVGYHISSSELTFISHSEPPK